MQTQFGPACSTWNGWWITSSTRFYLVIFLHFTCCALMELCLTNAIVPLSHRVTPDAGAVSMHFTALPPQLLAQRRAKLHRGMATVEREDSTVWRWRDENGCGSWMSLDDLGISSVGDGPAAPAKIYYVILKYVDELRLFCCYINVN